MGLLDITPERKAYWLGRFGTDSPRIGQVKEDTRVCFHENKHQYDPRTEQCVRCGHYRALHWNWSPMYSNALPN